MGFKVTKLNVVRTLLKWNLKNLSYPLYVLKHHNVPYKYVHYVSIKVKGKKIYTKG